MLILFSYSNLFIWFIKKKKKKDLIKKKKEDL